MDAAAELGRNPVSTRFSLSMEMSRLTRDGTADPVSRDQILRHARGQGDIIFPVQLTTSRIGNLTRLIHTLLYVMTIHTYAIAQLCKATDCRRTCCYLLVLGSNSSVEIFSRRYFQHAHFIPIVGVGKRGEY